MNVTDEPVRPSSSRGRGRGRPAGLVALVAAVALVASACVMNGTWASLPAPVPPVQSLTTGMNDVSCVSTDWCMAVGSFGSNPLVEVWDGTAWSVRPAPPVSGPPFPNGEMARIDCGAPDACVAQINRYPDAPEDWVYLVLWDGTQWHEVPPGWTIDGPYENLAPSSCAPDGTCLMFVQHANQLVRWDGTQFTSSPLNLGVDVQGTECFAEGDCLVLGTDRLYRWDGTSFTELPGSEVWPLAQVDTTFTCRTPTSCVSFGFTLDGSVGLHWDGASWDVTDLPVPGGSWSNKSDLSCGSTECVGVARIQGQDPTVVTWNGAGWYAAPALPAGLERLSCVGLACVAVGSTGSPSVPIASSYTWTNP